MILSVLGHKTGAVGSTRLRPEVFPAGRLQAGLLCETRVCLLCIADMCGLICMCIHTQDHTTTEREGNGSSGVKVEREVFKPKGKVKDDRPILLDTHSRNPSTYAESADRKGNHPELQTGLITEKTGIFTNHNYTVAAGGLVEGV